jgi:hypothetical protein
MSNWKIGKDLEVSDCPYLNDVLMEAKLDTHCSTKEAFFTDEHESSWNCVWREPEMTN